MTTPDVLASRWLERFAHALAGGGPTRLPELFREEAQWRDVLAFDWDIRTRTGPAEIGSGLSGSGSPAAPGSFRIDDEPAARIATRGGREVVEAFFRFDAAHGPGRGVLRLCVDDPHRAFTLMTSLDGLAGHEPGGRPRGGIYGHQFGGANWADHRRDRQRYEDRDPAVLVVGGGHAGLTLAARLTRLGVDTLVVDPHARVGDNWRLRYHALRLHNESWVCSLPEMPFPPSWPVYLPKDMVAGWLEAFAWAMELNVWTGASLTGATPPRPSEASAADDARWTAHVHVNGRRRTLRPRHLVIATGMSGSPRRPDLAGLGDFAGPVLHSSEFTDGSAWTGRRAVVVGTGNSGHDIAQDLAGRGASVTLVQRSPTTVTSVEPAAQLVFALYSEGPSVEDCDLLAVSMTHDVQLAGQQALTRKMAELDHELLGRLASVGYRTDQGPDESGYYMKYLRTGGGYYLDVGCAELVASGVIGVEQWAHVERFVPRGLLLHDGSTLEADLVVLATGYENLQQTARRLLGADVAAAVGPVWGFDEHGDTRNMWKPVAVPDLWFMGGSFAQCRTYSRYLALQITARELGICPTPHRVTA